MYHSLRACNIFLICIVLCNSKELYIQKLSHKLNSLFSLEIECCLQGSKKTSDFVWELPWRNHFGFAYHDLSSFKFTATEISTGSDPLQFIQNTRESIKINEVGEKWGLDYDCLSPLTYNSKSRKSKFTSKTLFLTISQLIKSTPALNPCDVKFQLRIIETANSLHLCSLNSEFKTSISQSWASRPFQYSASLDIDISRCVLNILKSKLNRFTDALFLDPCCGSGTNLFVARRYFLIISFTQRIFLPS